MKQKTKPAKTRRAFIKQATGIGGGAVMAGFATMVSTSTAFAQSSGDSPQVMLNLAATVETFVATHLTNLLTKRSFELTAAEELQARVLLASEQAHLDLAKANGGQAATTQFFFPPALYSDRALFAQTTAKLETACTAAYLAATRRFAELGDSRLAATSAQLACSEAQHVAVARDLIGAVPSDLAWAVPVFYNVSDAQPLLAPYLQGGGDYTLGAQYPGIDTITQLIGNAQPLLVVPPAFVKAF